MPQDRHEQAEPLTHCLRLPDAPIELAEPVRAWREDVDILTHVPQKLERNPMFLEKRLYQGSSGRVYLLPFIDRIAIEPERKMWKAIHIENEYLRLMILPEIGGRIHLGYDKTTGYDFFYRQNVIKPALVGLAGPWISGGDEFNWPQHHRPATFMPAQTEIENSTDGSITVWCSDHDPMLRMKGMHGFCLDPGCAVLELEVRLYNRTQFTQTFLWWAIRIRASAVSISVAALWVASFVLTYTFPLLNRSLGTSGAFLIYAGICFAGAAFVYLSISAPDDDRSGRRTDLRIDCGCDDMKSAAFFLAFFVG